MQQLNFWNQQYWHIHGFTEGKNDINFKFSVKINIKKKVLFNVFLCLQMCEIDNYQCCCMISLCKKSTLSHICFSMCMQIMRYAEQRIPTLNEYCVVCDERHVFQNGTMLKVHCWKEMWLWFSDSFMETKQKDCFHCSFSSVSVCSQQFAPGNSVSFPFIPWGLCLELRRRWPLVQRSVTRQLFIL